VNEVTNYFTQYNIGANKQGTAIVTRDGIHFRIYHYKPFCSRYGSQIPRGVCVINEYAPSRIVNCLIFLGRSVHILLGRDFNYILEASDSTGGFNYGRTLAELVHGLTLTDTWQGNPARNVYTYYFVSGATRIERIYTTQELLARELVVDVIVTTFTDHLAVCLRISTALPILLMGRGLWKMDSVVITENACTEKLRTLSGRLQRQKESFAVLTMWWGRSCKRKNPLLFQREQAERRREHRMMENHIYDCMYVVLKRPGPQ